MALIDDICGLDCSLRRLRSFGVTMAAIGVIVSAWLWWREIDSWPWLLAAAVVLATVGWIVPSSLRPIYRVWMTIALVLGWIVTRVVLTVVFYLVVTPTALIARLSGKRFLDLRPDPSQDSYWTAREKSDRDHHEQYEQQF
jgi:hypothetical protein